MEKEKTYIPYDAGGYAVFMSTNIIEEIEVRVNKYNAERSTKIYDALNNRVRNLGHCCFDYKIYELARAVAVLEIAREGRMAHRIWNLSCDIAFANGDLEFCRELAIRNAREGYSDRDLNPLKRESADQNVADIMGMITDELGKKRRAFRGRLRGAFERSRRSAGSVERAGCSEIQGQRRL